MAQTPASASGLDIIDRRDTELILKLNNTLYSDEIIFRAVYSFTGRCTILLDRIDPDHVLVHFTGGEPSALSSLVGEFANELIDQRVRADVANETRAIRELIVAQAFAEADLPPLKLPPDGQLTGS